MIVTSVVALLAISKTVCGIAFPGPAPTAASDAFEVNMCGRSPKPTGGPPTLPELFRRQSDDGMCGYLRGDSDAPISCSVGSCLYNERISWFGCCTGTMRSDCQLFTTCVGRASISSCLSNSACANDDYALACTESTAGVCMTMWGTVSEGTVNHYVCGSTSASVQVVPDPTGAGGGSTAARATSASTSGSVSSLPRLSSSTQTTSRLDNNDDTIGTTPGSRATTASTSDNRPRINTAVTATTRPTTTAPSTAGAVKTAQAVLGVAGGLVGVLAVLP